MKKVLIIWPSALNVFNSDFWKNVLLYEMEGYLDKKNIDVSIYDGSKYSTLEELIKILIKKDFDYYLLNAPLDSFDGFEKTLAYLKLIKPDSNVLVYGFSTILNKSYFKKLNIDCYTTSGYFEKGILSYINGNKDEMCNISYKENGEWVQTKTEKGTPEEWGFTKIEEALDMPVLRVTVSKGCRGACKFCSAYRLHGNVDNRKPVDEVIDYLQELQYNKYQGVVEFASPTFTVDKDWVLEFCEKYNERKIVVPWRCVSRIDELDETIIRKMSNSNCIRIGVGIETMKKDAQNDINKIINEEKIKETIELCHKYNIEILTYLIFGLYENSDIDIIETYNILKKLGANPRITSLVDYLNLDFNNSMKLSMQSDMTTTKLDTINKDNIQKVLSLIMGTADEDNPDD